MSCYSCRFSYLTDVLRCEQDGRWATVRCRKFEYEPGTDEGERESTTEGEGAWN